MTQITKDQHFVPRFYLKRFAREGQIQVFDKRAKRIGKPRPYASVCYDKFFYAARTGVQDETSQAFEDLFGQIESVIADALPGVIKRAGDLELTNNDLDSLAIFMSVQWLRTRFFRERVQKIYSDMMKWVLQMKTSGPRFQHSLRRMNDERDVSDEQIEEVKRFIQSGEYDLRFDNAPHLNFIDEEKIKGFCNLLLAKKWRIIFSERPYYFITSDNPVAEWIPPRTGIFGATFMERKHYLALTPHILIETIRPDGMDPEQQPVERLSYHAANGKGVLIFNIVLANHAHQFAYAPQIGEFERLLELVSKAGNRDR